MRASNPSLSSAVASGLSASTSGSRCETATDHPSGWVWARPDGYRPGMPGKKTPGPSVKDKSLYEDLREEGYIPEAVVNFLARLGWAYDDKTEVFSREDLLRLFRLDRVSSSPA